MDDDPTLRPPTGRHTLGSSSTPRNRGRPENLPPDELLNFRPSNPSPPPSPMASNTPRTKRLRPSKKPRSPSKQKLNHKPKKSTTDGGPDDDDNSSWTFGPHSTSANLSSLWIHYAGMRRDGEDRARRLRGVGLMKSTGEARRSSRIRDNATSRG
jgi:hypothetical protein